MPVPRTPEGQRGLIAELSSRHPGLRFDTAFISQAPMTAEGRYGRRYFHFRFRYDTATLRLGKQDSRRDRSELRRALRKLRRSQGEPSVDDLGAWFRYNDARNTLRRRGRNVLGQYPDRVSAVAGIGNVTGERYCGDLPPEQAAELFEELLSGLQPVTPDALSTRRRHLQGILNGSRTRSMHPHRIAITKHSRRKKR